VTGTLLNVGTVLAGGAFGTVVGGRVPAGLRQTLMQAVGLTTLAIGARAALGADNPLVLLGSVVLGGAIGELLRIERGLDRLSALAARATASGRAGPSSALEADPTRREVGAFEPSAMSGGSPGEASGGRKITQGFVTASLIFCVGPMTILGSFEDGLTGAYQTLAVKSALDGFTAALLASSLGWGVLLAAVTVLVYQGSLTLGAGLLRDHLTTEMISAMTSVGGLLILGLGLNILNIARIRVGNMLPSLAVAPVLAGLSR